MNTFYSTRTLKANSTMNSCLSQQLRSPLTLTQTKPKKREMTESVGVTENKEDFTSINE